MWSLWQPPFPITPSWDQPSPLTLYHYPRDWLFLMFFRLVGSGELLFLCSYRISWPLNDFKESHCIFTHFWLLVIPGSRPRTSVPLRYLPGPAESCQKFTIQRSHCPSFCSLFHYSDSHLGGFGHELPPPGWFLSLVFHNIGYFPLYSYTASDT